MFYLAHAHSISMAETFRKREVGARGTPKGATCAASCGQRCIALELATLGLPAVLLSRAVGRNPFSPQSSQIAVSHQVCWEHLLDILSGISRSLLGPYAPVWDRLREVPHVELRQSTDRTPVEKGLVRGTDTAQADRDCLSLIKASCGFL